MRIVTIDGIMYRLYQRNGLTSVYGPFHRHMGEFENGANGYRVRTGDDYTYTDTVEMATRLTVAHNR